MALDHGDVYGIHDAAIQGDDDQSAAVGGVTPTTASTSASGAVLASYDGHPAAPASAVADSPGAEPVDGPSSSASLRVV
jgi:hypothetical protein